MRRGRSRRFSGRRNQRNFRKGNKILRSNRSRPMRAGIRR